MRKRRPSFSVSSEPTEELSSILILKTEATSFDLPDDSFDIASPARSQSRPRDRLATFLLPFGVAAGFVGLPADNVCHRYRFSGASPRFSFIDSEWDDAWNVVLEPLSRDQVADLERLWQLPYAGPVTFDFRDLD